MQRQAERFLLVKVEHNNNRWLHLPAMCCSLVSVVDPCHWRGLYVTAPPPPQGAPRHGNVCYIASLQAVSRCALGALAYVTIAIAGS